MFRFSKTQSLILSIAVGIAIIGLITGWYFFIFLVLPIGFLFRKKE